MEAKGPWNSVIDEGGDVYAEKAFCWNQGSFPFFAKDSEPMYRVRWADRSQKMWRGKSGHAIPWA